MKGSDEWRKERLGGESKRKEGGKEGGRLCSGIDTGNQLQVSMSFLSVGSNWEAQSTFRFRELSYIHYAPFSLLLWSLLVFLL